MDRLTEHYLAAFYSNFIVYPGGPVVIVLATGSGVRGFKPGWDRCIFSDRKKS